MPINSQLSNVYQLILQTYLNNLSQMRKKDQLHFLNRMFRITGHEQYLTSIREILQGEIVSQLDQLSKINENPVLLNINPRETVRGPIRRNQWENKRIIRRETYYQVHPEVKFYFESLSQLSFLYEYNIHNGKYSSQVRQVTKLFKHHDWQQTLLKKDVFLIHPVLFINSVYRLTDLEIIQFKQLLEDWIIEEFNPTLVCGNERLFDQIYALTHLLINESGFYQHMLTRGHVEHFSWIFDFFLQNFKHIYTQLNLDLVLEILLCFKLANINNRKMEITAEAYLQGFISKNTSILKSDAESTLADMEHANILLLMYLNFPTDFSSISYPLL